MQHSAIPKAAEALRALPHVTDVGLGLRTVGGRMTDELAIVVYVDRKRALGSLPMDARVPPVVAGMPTDVQEELDPAYMNPGDGPLVTDRTRVRPLLSGVSIGTSADHAGTLGFFARRNSDNKAVLVGNYHVLYRNRGLLDITGEPHEVLQPPRGADNKIATVVGGQIGGNIDAAFATIEEEGSSCCCRSTIPHENKTRSTGATSADDAIQLVGIRRAQVDEVVTKTGRSTGLTRGKVVSVNKAITGAVDYSDYDLPAGTSFTFSDLIMVVSWDPVATDFTPEVPFASDGDSGSALVNAAGEIVGLHFMSYHDPSTNRHFSFACHIQTVETALGITVPGTRAGLGGAAGPAIASLDDTIDPAAGTVVIGDMTFPRGVAEAAWQALDARLSETAAGQAWRGIFARHHFEVLGLVNRRRGVTVAWQRSQGPAWLAALVRSVTRPGYMLPDRIDGGTVIELAQRMRAALDDAGSDALRADLARLGPQLLGLIAAARSVPEGIDLLRATPPATERDRHAR